MASRSESWVFRSYVPGVSFWRDAKANLVSVWEAILLGTLDARLIALDAMTGKLCQDFGSAGFVDLSANAFTTPEWRGGYQSPPHQPLRRIWSSSVLPSPTTGRWTSSRHCPCLRRANR